MRDLVRRAGDGLHPQPRGLVCFKVQHLRGRAHAARGDAHRRRARVPHLARARRRPVGHRALPARPRRGAAPDGARALQGRAAPSRRRWCATAAPRPQDGPPWGARPPRAPSSRPPRTCRPCPAADVLDGRPHYAEAVLFKICAEAWQRRPTARRRGREEGEADNALVLRQREAELSVRAEELEEALRREAALRGAGAARAAPPWRPPADRRGGGRLRGRGRRRRGGGGARGARAPPLPARGPPQGRGGARPRGGGDQGAPRQARFGEEQWKEAFESGIEELKRTSEANRQRVERERDFASRRGAPSSRSAASSRRRRSSAPS